MSDLDIRGPLGEPDEHHHSAWEIQFQRSLAWAHAEYPNGYDITIVGEHAWSSLPDEHKQSTLRGFFSDYWVAFNDQRNAERFDADSRDGKHYADGTDVAIVWDAVLTADGEEATVYRQSLLNVLCELELLQHRIACLERTDMDAPDESGESQ